MGGISTFYNPGSVTTQAPVGNTGGVDPRAFFYEMARRRVAEQPHGAGASSGEAQRLQQRLAGPAMQERPFDMEGDRLRHAQINDQLLQMQARQQQAPMRVVGGAGIVPGYMQDVNAMNAYQRQAYLPEKSETVSAGPETPTGSIASVDGSAAARLRTPEEQAAHDDAMVLRKHQIQAEANARYGGRR